MKNEGIKKAVLEAAREVFKEVGFEKSDMRTIAQKAGIAVGTIYNYFSGKDELFETIITQEKNDYHGRPPDFENDTPSAEEKLYNICQTQLALITRYGAVYKEVAGLTLKENLSLFIKQFDTAADKLHLDIDKFSEILMVTLETLAMADETGSQSKENCDLITKLFWSGLQTR